MFCMFGTVSPEDKNSSDTAIFFTLKGDTKGEIHCTCCFVFDYKSHIVTISGDIWRVHRQFWYTPPNIKCVLSISHYDIPIIPHISACVRVKSHPVCPRKLSDCNKELEVALREQAKTAEEDAQAIQSFLGTTDSFEKCWYQITCRPSGPEEDFRG